MAHVYELRDSGVYLTPVIEGYLEKKGVLGKTKMLCYLQGSTMYLKKSQGDVMSTIDMRDAHQVRKVTSDSTSTQFEIIVKKKPKVFVCPSSEDCNLWVKALINAMTLKDSGIHNSNFFVDSAFTEDINVYNTITEEEPENGSKSPVKEKTQVTVSEYADPDDHIKPGTEYAELGNMAQVAMSPSPQLEQASHTAKNDTTTSPTEQEQTYDYGYSLVQKDIGQESNVYVDGASEPNIGSMPKENEESLKSQRITESKKELDAANVYNEVSSENASNVHCNEKKTTKRVSFEDKEGFPKSSEEGNDDEDSDDDPFERMDYLLSNLDDTIPEFVHPLTDEDREPMQSLQEFLDNNQEFCRVSYRCSSGDDPVASLRSFLATLNT